MAKGHDLYAAYEEAHLLTSFLIRAMAEAGKLDPDEIDAVFKVNKELRRYYDLFGRPGRGGFDEVYRPFGGWSFYFERNENDLPELERHEAIQSEVAASLGEGRFPEL